MTLYRPFYRLDSESIAYLEKIARLEGEIHVATRGRIRDTAIQAEATIDSVHYSTRIEGNALTREQVTEALSGKRRGFLRQQRDLKEVVNYARARHLLFEKAQGGLTW